MPTFSPTPRFLRDLNKLTGDEQQRFKRVVLDEFVPDLAAGHFRVGLRVKGVRGVPGVFEMTWAPDGRATWRYGSEQRPGEPYVIWLRIGGHGIFGV